MQTFDPKNIFDGNSLEYLRAIATGFQGCKVKIGTETHLVASLDEMLGKVTEKCEIEVIDHPNERHFHNMMKRFVPSQGVGYQQRANLCLEIIKNKKGCHSFEKVDFSDLHLIVSNVNLNYKIKRFRSCPDIGLVFFAQEASTILCMSTSHVELYHPPKLYIWKGFDTTGYNKEDEKVYYEWRKAGFNKKMKKYVSANGQTSEVESDFENMVALNIALFTVTYLFSYL